MDYRDEVLICIEALKNNDYLQNKDKYIFISDAQNLTTIQLELLKLLTHEENLYLYGDSNAKIQTFQGANAFKKQTIDCKEKSRNKDILKRALFITDNFLESNKTDTIKYRIFPSFNDEIEHIAKEIICNVNCGANYSDFAILIVLIVDLVSEISAIIFAPCVLTVILIVFSKVCGPETDVDFHLIKYSVSVK